MRAAGQGACDASGTGAAPGALQRRAISRQCPGDQRTRMKVSILVNNHNYAAYVGAAIESALAQDHADCEVVVADDGSTDDSWRVIQSFGSRIRALREAHGGQGAVYNALWQAAQGDCVLFLDADDRLDPDAVSTCLAALQPDTAAVQFRLRLIDAEGRPLKGAVPYLMHEGDVTPLLRRFAHYAGPPGSGNFYRRSAIAPAFPLDAAHWPRAADTVPFVAAGLAGRVVAVRRPLGAYRLHHAAAAGAGLFGNIDATYHASLAAWERRHQGAQAIARHAFATDLPGPFLLPPTAMRTRALSWKLDRAHHPYADSRLGLLRMLRAALRDWPGYGRLERMLLLGWMVAVLALPAELASLLARSQGSAELKGWVQQHLGTRSPAWSGRRRRPPPERS